MAVTGKKCIVFVFPGAAGHVNPSLALARTLVSLGHDVHYVCCAQFRQAIEDTGATLHVETDIQTSLYGARGQNVFEVTAALQKEHGLEQDSFVEAFFKLGVLQSELKIPDMVRFLQGMRASAVVHCASNSSEASWAAKILDIPSIGLLSLPGPGSLPGTLRQFLSPEQLADIRGWGPGKAAAERLSAKYGLEIRYFGEPVGALEWLAHSFCTLVTTVEELQDPMSAELSTFYKAKQVTFSFVGPLLDQRGALRAAGHKADALPESSVAKALTPGDVIEKVNDARSLGRKVVYVSMGTCITGDDPENGWEGRKVNADKQAYGLTGRELCRAAWGAAFEAFGAQFAENGPLLVISLGPQPDALGSLVPPPNAICLPVIPQVDVLHAGVDLFLTHGGQNSFMESLAAGTPVLVCPGFGDQPLNAEKAVNVGVGLKVDRPEPAIGDEAAAVQQYQAEIFSKLKKLMGSQEIKAKAASFIDKMQRAGGVSRAVDLILQAAETGAKTATLTLSSEEAVGGA